MRSKAVAMQCMRSREMDVLAKGLHRFTSVEWFRPLRHVRRWLAILDVLLGVAGAVTSDGDDQMTDDEPGGVRVAVRHVELVANLRTTGTIGISHLTPSPRHNGGRHLRRDLVAPGVVIDHGVHVVQVLSRLATGLAHRRTICLPEPHQSDERQERSAIARRRHTDALRRDHRRALRTFFYSDSVGKHGRLRQ